LKINTKIIGILVTSFLVISFFFSFSSINTLRQSQTENIRLFKEEYLELVRELFNDSSVLFFKSFNVNTDNRKLFDYINETDPLGKSVFVIDLSGRSFLNNFNNPEIIELLDQATIDKFIQENILNQTTDFELDNFNSFTLDQTNIISPTKISLQIHPEHGHLIGYYKTFTTSKVRIQFIEQENQVLFQSYVTSQIVFSIFIVLTLNTLTIISMRNIIIKPLKAMASGLKQVKEGNLETKLDIRKKDEMGEIAVAFNNMTEDLNRSRKDLQDYAANLEVKVKGRTQEMEDKNLELEKLNLELKDKYQFIERMNELMVNRELKMVQLKDELEALKKKSNPVPVSGGV
jgi:nitrogen fixation/metabolism regulation signal transduction histidine kinase